MHISAFPRIRCSKAQSLQWRSGDTANIAGVYPRQNKTTFAKGNDRVSGEVVFIILWEVSAMAEKLNCSLEEILESQGIKKIWLARKAGISKTSIIRIVQGGDVRLSIAKKIARELGRSVEEIWPE